MKKNFRGPNRLSTGSTMAEMPDTIYYYTVITNIEFHCPYNFAHANYFVTALSFRCHDVLRSATQRDNDEVAIKSHLHQCLLCFSTSWKCNLVIPFFVLYLLNCTITFSEHPEFEKNKSNFGYISFKCCCRTSSGTQ